MKRRKLVVVGDGASGASSPSHHSKLCNVSIIFLISPTSTWFSCSGKTALLWVFALKGRPDKYIPQVYEAPAQKIKVDNRKIELDFLDTSAPGHRIFERLRPSLYTDSHVIIICYAVDRPETLQNVTEKVRTLFLLLQQAISELTLTQWIPEVKHFCPKVPIVLVGCKKDLRRDPSIAGTLRRHSQAPVTFEQVRCIFFWYDYVSRTFLLFLHLVTPCLIRSVNSFIGSSCGVEHRCSVLSWVLSS